MPVCAAPLTRPRKSGLRGLNASQRNTKHLERIGRDDKMRYFMEPSTVLATREETIRFLQITLRKNLAYPDAYLIRSEYIVSTIERMKGARGFVYNADAKKELARDLFGQELSDEDAGTEGDLLSLLIYNAQGFHRSDLLQKSGYEPATETFLAAAFDNKRMIETPDGKQWKPRYVEGKLYAMYPRSRTKCLSMSGQPVRLRLDTP